MIAWSEKEGEEAWALIFSEKTLRVSLIYGRVWWTENQRNRLPLTEKEKDRVDDKRNGAGDVDVKLKAVGAARKMRRVGSTKMEKE